MGWVTEGLVMWRKGETTHSQWLRIYKGFIGLEVKVEFQIGSKECTYKVGEG